MLLITGVIAGFIIACLTIRAMMSKDEVTEMKEQYRKDTATEQKIVTPKKKKRNKRIHELK